MEDGPAIHIVLADYDTGWMMETAQELMIHPRIRVVGFARNGDFLKERVLSLNADAVLMDYSLADISAPEMAMVLAKANSNAVVFAVSESFSREFTHHHSSDDDGEVAEVYPRELSSMRDTAISIVEEVDRIRRMIADHSGGIVHGIKQSVIVSYNIKGGVGKTTLATNLAVAIKSSPHMNNFRVCLVDFDCGGANATTVLHINESEAINRNIANWEHMHDDASIAEVDDMLIRGPKGLLIAPAPINQAQGDKVDMEMADRVLRILKKHFAIIVIDGAPNISAPIDSAFSHATHILMVTSLEGQSVKQLSKTTYLFAPNSDLPNKPDMSHVLKKMFIVVNNTSPKEKYDLKSREISEVVGRPFIGEIPYDSVVRKALHGPEKKTAFELEPHGAFAKGMKNLAHNICGAYPEEGSNKNGRANKAGRFSNLGDAFKQALSRKGS